MLPRTLLLYCERHFKRRKHLQKRLSSPKMSVIKLKSNDEKIFEVDIEVTITNAASIWIYNKCDTSNKCHLFTYLSKVAKKSLIVKGLLENGATEGDVSVCLFWTHFEFFFLLTFPRWNHFNEMALCQEGASVPLPMVRGEILEKVLEWATSHKVREFNSMLVLNH